MLAALYLGALHGTVGSVSGSSLVVEGRGFLLNDGLNVLTTLSSIVKVGGPGGGGMKTPGIASRGKRTSALKPSLHDGD